MSEARIQKLIENLLEQPDGWNEDVDVIIDELVSIGEPAIKPMIYHFLAHPDNYYPMDNTYEVIMGLKQMGDTVVDTLLEALVDSDEQIRHVAANALRDLGGKRTLPALENEMLVNTSYSALYAIGSIGGDTAAHMLLGALQTEIFEKSSIISWLGYTGSELALETLLKSLESDDRNIRYSAIQGIGNLAHPAAREYLHAMLSDEDKKIRHQAASVLASKYHDPRSATMLSHGFQDVLASGRESAIYWITQSGNKSYLKQIYRLFKGDKESSVRIYAAHSLIYFETNDGEATQYIEDILSSEDTKNHSVAIYAMKQIQHHLTLTWLLHARQDSNAALRYHAAQLIGDYGHQTEIGFLGKWLKDENNRLVKKSIKAAIERLEAKNNISDTV